MNSTIVRASRCFSPYLRTLFKEEDEEGTVHIPGVGPIAMHASNRDDPLLEIKDDVSSLLLHSTSILIGIATKSREKIPTQKIISFDPMIISSSLRTSKTIPPVSKSTVRSPLDV